MFTREDMANGCKFPSQSKVQNIFHKVFNTLQEDVVNHYRIGPDPDHVRKLVKDQHERHESNILIFYFFQIFDSQHQMSKNLIPLQAREARVLIPSLSIISVEGDSCVTSNTPGKIAPFIDTLDMVSQPK